MVTEHPAPAQAPDPSKRPGFVCGKCNMYCHKVASFKLHLPIKRHLARTVHIHSTTSESWVSTPDKYIGQHIRSGVIIKIVLTVTELLMVWSNMAGLMERRHGMQPTTQRTRRIGTSVLCVWKCLT